MESDEPITIVPIAAMTNIALLFALYPEVKSNIREIVMMGGSVTRGNKGVMSEFNVATDPEAAAMVFNSGVPIVMAGLDVGWKALVMPQDSEEIKRWEKSEIWHIIFSNTTEAAALIQDLKCMTAVQ